MRTPQLLVATRSLGKQREISELMKGIPIRIVFPDDVDLAQSDVEDGLETEVTFEGNARRKAEFFARRSDLPTAAEDSGLEVLALDSAPGVRSRRFAFPPRRDALAQDRANNEELLRRLSGVPPERRRARYRCALVYLPHADAAPRLFRGSCSGRILEKPRGTGGFGYDPLFLSDDLGVSFGEAEAHDKHRVSHRGRALHAFAQFLIANHGSPPSRRTG